MLLDQPKKPIKIKNTQQDNPSNLVSMLSHLASQQTRIPKKPNLDQQLVVVAGESSLHNRSPIGSKDRFIGDQGQPTLKNA